MKISHPLSGMACVLLASILALPAAAVEKESGFYINVGIGANLAESVDLQIASVSSSADLDVGVRLGVGVGYNINRYLGVEFDTGFLWNEFDDADGSLSHIPFMVNGVVRFPNASKFEPYLGGGIGGSANILYIDDVGVDDADTDFNFAWQAMAGVRYKFNKNIALGVGYKYFGTSSSSYDIDWVDVDIDTSNNHTINLVFNVMF